MKNLVILSLLLFSISSFAQSKNDSIPATQITLLKTNYKDFVVADKLVYAISKGDSLVVLDFKTERNIEVIPDIKNISKTSKNEFYLIDTCGEIFLKKGNDIKSQGKIAGDIYSTLVDKNDNLIAVCDKGIFYKNEIFYPKEYCYAYHTRAKSNDAITKFLDKPTVAYLDKQEQIWLSFDYGEFGEISIFFDLKGKEFYRQKELKMDYDRIIQLIKKRRKPGENAFSINEFYLERYPDKVINVGDRVYVQFPFTRTSRLSSGGHLKGISQNDAGDFFLSKSLQHFILSGELDLMTFLNKDDKIFLSVNNLSSVLEKKNELLNEYIGTNTFNRHNNSFYYYSDKGFFKIVERDNKYSKEFVFKPWIKWTYGLPTSVGYQMNVEKFEFISEHEMIFLTSNNGIGYFDGKTVKYFM